MVKRYNRQIFSYTVNGAELGFIAYTTRTRCGFCHTVSSLDYPVRDTKVSYLNRTWERFDYETALKGMIRKFPKGMQEEMTRQLVERTAKEEHDKAATFLGNFERLYNGLSSDNKKQLAGSGIEIHTEGEARAVMGLMTIMSI